MTVDAAMLQRILELRRQVRVADARPNDGRCGNVAAAITAEFGWNRECGYLRLRDGSVSWFHCWNRVSDAGIVDATADQFGSLWLGDVAVIEARDDALESYLPDPQQWDLRPAGPVHALEGLICSRAGRERLLLVEDPARPWLSLARAALHLVTGWELNERPAEIAARALRAKIESERVISTADLVRPLVTESIQHLSRQSSQPWTAAEFRSPV